MSTNHPRIPQGSGASTRRLGVSATMATCGNTHAAHAVLTSARGHPPSHAPRVCSRSALWDLPHSEVQHQKPRESAAQLAGCLLVARLSPPMAVHLLCSCYGVWGGSGWMLSASSWGPGTFSCRQHAGQGRGGVRGGLTDRPAAEALSLGALADGGSGWLRGCTDCRESTQGQRMNEYINAAKVVCA
jgi:hypothetical protein